MSAECGRQVWWTVRTSFTSDGPGRRRRQGAPWSRRDGRVHAKLPGRFPMVEATLGLRGLVEELVEPRGEGCRSPVQGSPGQGRAGQGVG